MTYKLGFLICALSMTTSLWAGTSEEKRAPGTFGFGLGLGTFLYPVSGLSISTHYNYSSALQFELRGASGTSDNIKDVDLNYNTLYVSTRDMKAELYEVRAKYFFGNTFYLASGLGDRVVTSVVKGSTQLTNVEYRFKANSACLQFGLGNIWTLNSGLFLGAEWFALAIPLKAKTSGSYKGSGVADEDSQRLQNDANSATEELGKSITAGVVTFHIGYQL